MQAMTISHMEPRDRQNWNLGSTQHVRCRWRGIPCETTLSALANWVFGARQGSSEDVISVTVETRSLNTQYLVSARTMLPIISFRYSPGSCDIYRPSKFVDIVLLMPTSQSLRSPHSLVFATVPRREFLSRNAFLESTRQIARKPELCSRARLDGRCFHHSCSICN